MFGCSDPTPPDHGFIKHDKDQAEVHCHISRDDTWEIFCHNGEWVGDLRNCSTGT